MLNLSKDIIGFFSRFNQEILCPFADSEKFL